MAKISSATGILNKAYTSNLEAQRLASVEKTDHINNVTFNGPKNRPKGGAGSLDEAHYSIDRFEPSLQLERALASKKALQSGFKNMASFMHMIEGLKRQSLLSSQDVATAHVLAQKSEGVNFAEFNEVMRDKSINIAMRGLISELLQKLKMINFVSNAGIV